MKIVTPLLILLLTVLACINPGRRNSVSPNDAGRTPSQPKLKLLTMRGTIGSSFVTVEGEVENISEERIENVQAVVSHYDGNSQFVTSDTALIEYNPIMPHQKSPYKVMTRYNPVMKTFQVSFKELMGSEIDVIDGTTPPSLLTKKKR